MLDGDSCLSAENSLKPTCTTQTICSSVSFPRLLNLWFGKNEVTRTGQLVRRKQIVSYIINLENNGP